MKSTKWIIASFIIITAMLYNIRLTQNEYSNLSLSINSIQKAIAGDEGCPQGRINCWNTWSPEGGSEGWWDTFCGSNCDYRFGLYWADQGTCCPM